MIELGWKKKADRLKMTILSAGHQMAQELPPGLMRLLELFARAVRTGDGSGLQEEIDRVPPDERKLLWEPVEIYGWKIQASMYKEGGQLWWVLHATRRDERVPSEKHVVMLDKILEHLGADPVRDAVIAPRTRPPGADFVPFGWWRWFNRWPLYEVQVDKDRRKKEMIRIVPLGSPATDGYQTVDLTAPAGDE